MPHPTLDQLIAPDGQPRYGLFEAPPRHINYLDYDFLTPLGGAHSRLFKRLRFHQFLFQGLLSPDLVLGWAVIDLRYLSNAFFYVYQPPKSRLKEFSLIQPFSHKTHFSQQPEAGRVLFHKGKNHFSIELAPGRQVAEIALESGTQLAVELTEPEQGLSPLCLCTRAGINGWIYTQKQAGLRCQGQLVHQGQRTDLSSLSMRGVSDFSAGFMQRETFWNWASCAGAAQNGVEVGINFSAGVNETGFTENCYWINGQKHHTHGLNFSYNRRNLRSPWQIATPDGQVNLNFRPEGVRKEKKNYWVLASNFQQLFGTFSGVLKAANGTEVVLENMYGFVEEHYALW